MNIFSIRDIENLSGIKAHTIRIWEQRYSFLKPQRTDTNIRYYTNEDLKVILNISLLNRFGYKVSQIDQMSEEEIQEKVIELNTTDAQKELIINNLISCMVDFNLEDFDEVLSKQIRKIGIERTIVQIIFPFLERIGILWQTGHIGPAQEHLITSIIRQKLIAGTEGLKPLIKIKQSFLLFLPEHEFHELGLLFVQYLLKSRGAMVYYLGANIPLEEVGQVIEIKKPDYLYSHLTSTSANFRLSKFIQSLSRLPGKCLVLLSGYVVAQHKPEVPARIRKIASLSEVVQLISSLK